MILLYELCELIENVISDVKSKIDVINSVLFQLFEYVYLIYIIIHLLNDEILHENEFV